MVAIAKAQHRSIDMGVTTPILSAACDGAVAKKRLSSKLRSEMFGLVRTKKLATPIVSFV